MHTKRAHNVYKQTQSTSHSYKHDIIRHSMKEDRRNTCNEINSADVIIGAKSSFLNFEIIVLIFFMSLNNHFLFFFLIREMFYSEVAVVSHSLQLT